MERNSPAGHYRLESAPIAEMLDLGADFDLRKRSNLLDLDRQLHAHWSLGKNFILGWAPDGNQLLLLVVAHYQIADYAIATQCSPPESAESEGHAFIMRLLAGSRQFSCRQLENAARLLATQTIAIKLRQPLGGSIAESRLVDRMVRRYGVSYVPSRAVALFDIVGFSLLGPFDQMTQLNSLSHSLNSAHSKLLASNMHVDFARSSTGDGFYIWNRDVGVQANTNLYHLMHLVLADNAIARRKAHGRTVPLLRAGFHVASCYEYHQAEGLSPTIRNDIVGEVTIELARMIERALPGQILVGDFEADLPAGDDFDGSNVRLDAIEFIEQAQDHLVKLNGLELSGEAIESIRCYLTGMAQADGTFTIRKLAINDKHGLTRNVFNAKINIYRRAAEPILLGIEDRMLRGDALSVTTAGHIHPAPRH